MKSLLNITYHYTQDIYIPLLTRFFPIIILFKKKIQEQKDILCSETEVPEPPVSQPPSSLSLMPAAVYPYRNIVNI